MKKLDDYYRQISGYDEFINNNDIRKLLSEELEGNIWETKKYINEDDIFCLECLYELNNEIFDFSILFEANEVYKFCMLRKSSKCSMSYGLIDLLYNKKFENISMIRLQKGEVRGNKYYIENLLYRGTKYSYTSNVYDVSKMGPRINAIKSDAFMESIKPFMLDSLVIDCVSNYETYDYMINHNGKYSYIQSDNLNETIDELLSNGVNITLELK